MNDLWLGIGFLVITVVFIKLFYLFLLGWGHRGKYKMVPPGKANIFDRIMLFLLVVGYLIMTILVVSKLFF